MSRYILVDGKRVLIPRSIRGAEALAEYVKGLFAASETPDTASEETIPESPDEPTGGGE